MAADQQSLAPKQLQRMVNHGSWQVIVEFVLLYPPPPLSEIPTRVFPPEGVG